jgi:hypothetical protein
MSVSTLSLSATMPTPACLPRHDADGEGAELLGQLRDDRSGARTGTAALAGGHEDHVGALERVAQLVLALHGGLEADIGIGACAEPTSDLAAYVDLHVCVTHLQRLCIRIDGDELDAAKTRVHHPVDGVGAPAAHAYHLDHGEVVR